MHADRYGASGGLKPGSLALTLGLGGAMLGGLVLFANPAVRARIEKTMTIKSIPVETEKPKPLPPIEHKQEVKRNTPMQREHIDTTTPVTVDRPINTYPDFPPLPTPGAGDLGGGTVVEPIKPLPPVITGPEIDKRFAANFQPVYPADERRAGNSGRVVVRILVGVDGHVKQIERVSAASDSFFETTRRRALDKWRFTPGTRDGIPVEAWRTIAVSFVMDGDE